MTNIEIGKRIADRRSALGLTMDEVAKEIGVAKSTIQRYETGQIKKLKLPVIESIAAVLQVNPDWLIGNSEDPTPKQYPKKSNRMMDLFNGTAGLPADDFLNQMPGLQDHSGRDGSEIMFALSRGGEQEITDEMFDEVKKFAAYIAQRENEKKEG